MYGSPPDRGAPSKSLFNNAGLIIERYYPASHHIEVRIFGNGDGKAIAIDERECSIQRRHPKVIEQCPSPFVSKNPDIGEGLRSAAAVGKAESINYGSAGTIKSNTESQSYAMGLTWLQDPLLAKVMFHAPTRQLAIQGMRNILTGPQVCGPLTNLEFWAKILADKQFIAGNTLTKFLDIVQYNLSAIDVVSGGSYALVQDWPGRPNLGNGFCDSEPMDSISSCIENAFARNPVSLEGLEITLSGPELRLLGPALISPCGAPIEAKLDGTTNSMWFKVNISAGQRLKIGKTTGERVQTILGRLWGGFLNVFRWFASKSTAPMVGVGGYQGYLTPESVDMLYQANRAISHNAARSGVRLLCPKPTLARSDARDAGAHCILPI